MKILVVGVSVRALAESAVHSGYAVEALDAFGDQDLKLLAASRSLHRDFNMIYSPAALHRASRQMSYDAVAYTSNLENYPGVLGKIADGRPIVGNLPRTIEAVRHWGGLFAKLRREGFPVPDTIQYGEKLKADCHHRWLIKPVLSGGGHGIAFYEKSKTPSRRFILQQHISGKACSASFVANGRDCVMLGITEQLIGMHPFGVREFHYCGNMLPLPEFTCPATGETILNGVKRLAEFLTHEYELTGVNGIDFILHGDEVFLTEVNPRYSASMELIEQGYGLPIFDLHARAVLEGRLPDFRLEDHRAAGSFFGKAILFADRNAVAPETKGWLHRGVRDVPARGERLLEGNPVCTVLASRPTCEETLADMIRSAALLKDEIYG